MNKDHDYGTVTDNQIRTLEHLGVFTNAPTKPPQELSHLVNPLDTHASLDQRARSYLHANCSHCHVDYGGGNARIRLTYMLPLEKTAMVDVVPQHGSFGVNNAKVLAPGDPDRSMMVYRMSKLGEGRMPHIASSVVDEEAVKLIRDWIKQLPP